MRTTFLLATLILIFAACKKDKYTTAPQIKFKSINPQFAPLDLTALTKDQAPKLTLEVTDAEGDIGFISGSDTARVYVKNLNTSSIDSFDFPNIGGAATKNFKADIIINLYNALECRNAGPNVPPTPRTDTIFYEVYVNDFAKNKSNVITTDQPVYYRCL